MTDPNNTFITPVGRIVGGSLSDPQTTDWDNKPCDPKWVVMLACPKSDPGTQQLIDKIRRVAQEGFAKAGIPHALQDPVFAWKFVDGDSDEANTKGKVHNKRTGYAGHIVFTISQPWAPTVCGDDPKEEIDPSSVERGYWVSVGGSVKASGKIKNPSVYLNLECAQFVRTDTVIGGGGMSCTEAFGSPSTSVTASQGVGHRPDLATSTPAPAHDLVNAAAGGPPPPPPPAGPQLTPAGVAAGCDPAAWLTAAQPWTLEQMKTAGYVV